jgi:hypothetical protein
VPTAAPPIAIGIPIGVAGQIPADINKPIKPLAQIVVPKMPALPMIALATPVSVSAPALSAAPATVARDPMEAEHRYVPAIYPLAPETISPPAACGTRLPPDASAVMIGTRGNSINIPAVWCNRFCVLLLAMPQGQHKRASRSFSELCIVVPKMQRLRRVFFAGSPRREEPKRTDEAQC